MSDIIAIGGTGFAVVAAAAYGLGAVAIGQGKATARGDNGVFLSILLTALLTGVLWLGFGAVSLRALMTPDNTPTIALFALAGLLSTVLGRTTMYRATERIGAVAASLLRRMAPVFALPIALLVLAEWPALPALIGGALVMGAVVAYLGWPSRAEWRQAGLWLGLASAAFYAAAYTVRRLGLETIPDAFLGTLIGALVGVVWFLLASLARHDRGRALRRLFQDRGRWHWLAALALSAGQTCQFIALQSAPVVVVAALGTLEVFFAALFGTLLLRQPVSAPRRLTLALVLALGGTVLLMG